MRKESSQTINTTFVKKTQNVLDQVLQLVKYLKLPLPDNFNINKNQTVTSSNFKHQIDTMQGLFQVFAEFYRTEENTLTTLNLKNFQLDLKQQSLAQTPPAPNSETGHFLTPPPPSPIRRRRLYCTALC